MEYEGPVRPNTRAAVTVASTSHGDALEWCKQKGMCLGLLKYLEPTDLRYATEDLEILRDCNAMGCLAACVHATKDTEERTVFSLFDRSGAHVERPTLQAVTFDERSINCPVNYLIAHGRVTGFHHFTAGQLVDFISYLMPSRTNESASRADPDSVFVIKLAACETGAEFARQVTEIAASRGMRLILLASPLFLYNVPVLDLAEFATQKHDVDVTFRKINYQNTITTRREYEQCMGYGVAVAYREILQPFLQRLEFVRVKTQAALSKLLSAIQQCHSLQSPADLEISEDLNDPGPLEGIHGSCQSFVAELRTDIRTYAENAFGTKTEKQQVAYRAPTQGALPILQMERVILEWFTGVGEFKTEAPTLRRIAQLAEARLIEQEELRLSKQANYRRTKHEQSASEEKRVQQGRDSGELPGPSAPEGSLPTPRYERYSLWFVYLDFMRVLERAAERAQEVFLTQLRDLLFTKVKGSELEKILERALSPDQNPRGSTVLARSQIDDGIRGVLGVTKGGYLIFSSIREDSALITDLIRRLSSYPQEK